MGAISSAAIAWRFAASYSPDASRFLRQIGMGRDPIDRAQRQRDLELEGRRVMPAVGHGEPPERLVRDRIEGIDLDQPLIG